MLEALRGSCVFTAGTQEDFKHLIFYFDEGITSHDTHYTGSFPFLLSEKQRVCCFLVNFFFIFDSYLQAWVSLWFLQVSLTYFH